MRRLLVALELARAHSALGAALAVWVGGRLAGAPWQGWWLAPMAVAALLSAAGNALNDAHDVTADAVSRPTRPIPRGAATPAQARRLAGLSTGAALLLALPFGWLSVSGTVAAILLFSSYSRYLKPIPLLGNLIVGGLAGMALGYGGLLAGDVPAILLPGAAFALLFAGREVLKTVPDAAGDRRAAITTVATAWGTRGAVVVTALIFALAVGLLVPWATPLLARRVGLMLLATLCALLLLPLARYPGSGRALTWAIGGSKAIGLVGLILLAAA